MDFTLLINDLETNSEPANHADRNSHRIRRDRTDLRSDLDIWQHGRACGATPPVSIESRAVTLLATCDHTSIHHCFTARLNRTKTTTTNHYA